MLKATLYNELTEGVIDYCKFDYKKGVIFEYYNRTWCTRSETDIRNILADIFDKYVDMVDVDELERYARLVYFSKTVQELKDNKIRLKEVFLRYYEIKKNLDGLIIHLDDLIKPFEDIGLPFIVNYHDYFEYEGCLTTLNEIITVHCCRQSL